MKVTILFIPAVRETIRLAVENNTASDYQLPTDFDTVGQTFENVIDCSITAGSVNVVLPARKDGDEPKVYGYPMHSIARYTVQDENCEPDYLLPNIMAY